MNTQDPKRPLSILPERDKEPLGFEQVHRAGQIKAESHLEEKKALDVTIIAAIIGAL